MFILVPARGGLVGPDPRGPRHRALDPRSGPRGRPRAGRPRPRRRRVPQRRVPLPRRRAGRPPRHLVPGGAGPDDRDRRQHRQRQVDAHQPDPALLRRDVGHRPRRRRRRQGDEPRGPLGADRADPPEGVPVLRDRRQQPPLRQGRRDRRGAVAGPRDRPGQALRQRDGGRPRRRDRPGRDERVGRPAPAALDRPGDRRRTPRSTSSTTASARSTSRPTRGSGPRSSASSATRR